MKIAIFRAKLQKNHDFWPKNGIFQIDKMVSEGPKIEKSSFLSFFAENVQKHLEMILGVRKNVTAMFWGRKTMFGETRFFS